MGRPAAHLLGQSELRAEGKVTTLRVVAILIDFPDMAADTGAHPPEYYRRLLFSRNELPGGSVADFLYESSHGRLEFTGEVGAGSPRPGSTPSTPRDREGWAGSIPTTPSTWPRRPFTSPIPPSTSRNSTMRGRTASPTPGTTTRLSTAS